MLNALTVDVEDYFQVQAFERQICRTRWGDFESRVVPNTERLLEVFAEHGVQGTFFILGWVAERFPDLVRQIAAAGHEVGSHSYWHRLIYEQTPEEFREDLHRSKSVLEDITGLQVESFRAPSFSVTRQSLWAIKIMQEVGIRFDSSIFPIYHDRYGIPGSPSHPYELVIDEGAILEFPASTWQFGPWRLPAAGGGYFRLYPSELTSRAVRQTNRQDQPFVFYIHPWEIDPDQPRLGVGSRLSRARHYLNLHATESKLRRLLTRHRFSTLTAALSQRQSWPQMRLAGPHNELTLEPLGNPAPNPPAEIVPAGLSSQEQQSPAEVGQVR